MNDEEILRQIALASGMNRSRLEVIEKTDDECVVKVNYDGYIFNSEMIRKLIRNVEDIANAEPNIPGVGVNRIYINFIKPLIKLQ
jgi:hypothetical protein